MSHTIPPTDTMSDSLTRLQKTQKPKILVVDDEPDNLDLLYRTFRRYFQVLRAESGIEALKVLADEGEVAVIISDQRMPEMKGTEFLSKTVPQFPNTIRIILTGFTDVEDLVEAINSGQVYKYITKPWDPEELKKVVDHATETYQLLKVQKDAVHRAQLQTSLLSTIIEVTGDTVDVRNVLGNLAAAFGDAFSTSSCVLQVVRDGNLADLAGVYSPSEESPNGYLVADPLVLKAIATQSIQFLEDRLAHEDLKSEPFYEKTETRSQLVIPLLSNGHVFAVLSLRWTDLLQSIGIQAEDVSLIFLLARQLALSLGCLNL